MCKAHYIPRNHSRFPIETPIIFAKPTTDNLFSAHMRNISEEGMYFETQYPIAPWSDVYIWIEKQPLKTHGGIRIYNFYRSKVIWCLQVGGSEILGIGVKHLNRSLFTSGPEFVCSICEDKIPLSQVHFYKDFIYFCADCYQQFENCSGKNRDEVLRFIEGNVF